MTDNQKNPFNPSFGKVPLVFIDREEYIDEITDGLSDLDSPWQTTMISGVRGVGKTAFLADICRRFERKKQWIVAELPSNGNLMETLVQSVHENASSDVRKALDSIEGVSVSLLGISAGYSSKPANINYQLLLEKILKKLKAENKYLLIAVDEVVPSTEMRKFAAIYQILVRKELPLALLMTGLPKNISELQNDHTLTFLLRSARIRLPMLDDVSVQYTYKDIFESAGRKISLSTLKRMTALTSGYSYAFQLLGFLLWKSEAEEITEAVVDSIMNKYKELLFRNAYSKIYEELSAVDRNFLLVMASDDAEEVAMQEIAAGMKKSGSYVSSYRRRLTESGVIRPAQYGFVRFALPLFKDYLREFRL